MAFTTEQIRSVFDGQALAPGPSEAPRHSGGGDPAGLALPAHVAAVLTSDELADPDVREFAWRARQVQADEKESDPDDWTAQERAAHDAGDWRRFSRLRGYTEQQIANFGRFMDLARRLDSRYGEGYAQELHYGLDCCWEEQSPLRLRQSAA